ncbi:hypothetical protein NBRC116592_06610 [Colwellia sp. KU-HH00111]
MASCAALLNDCASTIKANRASSLAFGIYYALLGNNKLIIALFINNVFAYKLNVTLK